MAISNDTVGLIFKLQADTAPAKAEISQFKGFLQSQVAGMTQNATAQFGVLGDAIGGLAAPSSLAGVAIAGVGLAAASLVSALVQAGNHAAKLGDQISDLRQITGLTADTLSGLATVAKLNDKSLEDFSGSLIRFNKNLVDAQRGSKELQSIFTQLGVDLTGTADQALRRVISRLSEMRDGATKAAVAQKLFGDEGARLIPILNDMEGGIDGAVKKAKELGFYFDNEGAEAAAAYQKQIKGISVEFDGLVTKIGQSVIPALTGLAAALRLALKDLREGPGKDSIFGALLDDVISGRAAVGAFTSVAANIGTRWKTGLPPGDEPPINLPKIGQRKEDKASAEALRRLQIQLQEEERAQKSAQEAIKRDHDQRLIDETEFAHRLIAQAEGRLAAEKAILDQEQAVVDKSKFSADKKKTETERINAARTDLERQTADELIRIDIDLARRLEQIGIQLEQAQAKTIEESFQRRREAIREAVDQEIITHEEAEKEFTTLTLQSIETRMALAQAEVDRTRENTQLKTVALEKLKALEIEYTAAVEEGVRRREAAAERDRMIALKREEDARQFRTRELEDKGFDSNTADAIATMEQIFQRALTTMEMFHVAFDALIEDMQRKTPTFQEVLLQMKVAVAQSFGAMVEAWVSGRATMRQALAGFLAAALEPLKKWLLQKATIQTALGIESLAMWDFAGAAKHFLAAAALGAAAGLIGAGTAAVAGSGAASVPSSYPGQSAGPSGPRIIEQGDRQRPAPIIIQLRAETEEGVVVRKVTDDYRNNGATRRMLRGDMLGEGAG